MCGDGGSLVCCDFCIWAFCERCIRRNAGLYVWSSDEELWKCFACDLSQLEDQRKEAGQLLEIGQLEVPGEVCSTLNPRPSRCFNEVYSFSIPFED